MQIRPRGASLLGEWVKYNEHILFAYLFIYTFFSRIRATQTRTKMFLSGVSLILLPILGVIYPQNPNFAEILKVSYYRNYCIDFNQILHNDRDHKVVIVGCPKHHISATF